MAISKVIYKSDPNAAGVVWMDVTDTTATAPTVLSPEYFYGADGVKTQGTATSGGGGGVKVYAPAQVKTTVLDGGVYRSTTTIIMNEVPEVGEVCLVTFEDDYSAEVKYDEDGDMYYIGDLVNDMPNFNQYPFFIVLDGLYNSQLFSESAGTYALSIMGSDSGGGGLEFVIVVQNVHVTYAGDNIYQGDIFRRVNDPPLVLGETYTVYWGPDAYTLTSTAFSTQIALGEASPSGPDFTNYPFLILDDGYNAVLFADQDGDYAIAVVKETGGDGSTTFKEYLEETASAITFPSGLTKIPDRAFYERTVSIPSIPDTVETIEDYGLFRCSGLTITKLPDNLIYIGGNALVRCTNMDIEEIPSGVTYIGGSAFQQCTGISKLSSEGNFYIGGSAFIGSSTYPMSITEVHFPNIRNRLNNNDQPLSSVFGASTAANACQLLRIADVGYVTGLTDNAFSNCYQLQTLVLRKTGSVCELNALSAIQNTPLTGYNGLTATVYVPQSLITSYQTNNRWSTYYNNGTVTFVAIEGSAYEL